MKIGFIDYYLDEWHANHYPQMIKDQSNSSMEVCYAYGKISSPHTGKTNEEWCIEHNIEYCDTIEILVKKSDAILVLAPVLASGGNDHSESGEINQFQSH